MNELLKTTSPENASLIASHAARRDMAREAANALGEQLEKAHAIWHRTIGRRDALAQATDALERNMVHWSRPDEKLADADIQQRRIATDFDLETLSELSAGAEREHLRASGARAALDEAFSAAEREYTEAVKRLEAVMQAVVAERDKPPKPDKPAPRRKTGSHPGKSLAQKRQAKT